MKFGPKGGRINEVSLYSDTEINICEQACENRAYLYTNFASFLNFNLMLLHTYLSYLRE